MFGGTSATAGIYYQIDASIFGWERDRERDGAEGELNSFPIDFGTVFTVADGETQ